MQISIEGILIFSVFYIYGFISIFKSIFQLIKAIQSKQWPSIDGEINQLLTLDESVVNIKGNVINKAAFATYIYYVNGTRYIGEVVKFDKYGTISHFNQYKQGDSIKIFYNPNNPNDACLVQGISTGSLVRFLPGLMLILIPSFIILKSIGVFS